MRGTRIEVNITEKEETCKKEKWGGMCADGDRVEKGKRRMAEFSRGSMKWGRKM